MADGRPRPQPTCVLAEVVATSAAGFAICYVREKRRHHVFRDDRQLASVCQALCGLVRLPTLWTATGPTDRAEELLKQGGGTLSHGEKVMLFIAWALWNGQGGLTFGEAIKTLDGGNLKAVGELLVALGEGSSAIDGWLEEYGPRQE